VRGCFLTWYEVEVLVASFVLMGVFLGVAVLVEKWRNRRRW
jgi:hypothetical protein